MGVGDNYSGLTSIASGGYYDIRPSLGVEAVIHNIYTSGSIQLAWTNGTNVIVFDSMTGSGVYAKFAFHVNNYYWIRIINTAGATIYVGWDGVQTK